LLKLSIGPIWQQTEFRSMYIFRMYF